MNKKIKFFSLQFLTFIASLFIHLFLFTTEVQAQLIPDTTLSNENSTVIDDVLIHGITSDRIEGGAIRDSNLFHSFAEFNVDELQRVYFANPIGVENILTRVTGENSSYILGTLGVIGEANLFLINPNGLYFGENAKLDINGSFFASTASEINLGDEENLNITGADKETLLTINPNVLFNPNNLQNYRGEIRNEGNLRLEGEKTLTLEGDILEINDLLSASEGNLNYLATTDKVVVSLHSIGRDNVTKTNINKLNIHKMIDKCFDLIWS